MLCARPGTEFVDLGTRLGRSFAKQGLIRGAIILAIPFGVGL